MGTLRQIILPVTDVGEAVAHYTEAFGLELRFQDGESWAVLDAGGLALALAGPGEQPPGPQPALAVKVTDLDGAVDDVVSAGGSILSTTTNGRHERRAACRDRFGTVIVLYEPSSA